MAAKRKAAVVKRRSSNYLKFFEDRVRICPVMKRCDGVHLPPGKDMCAACAKALAPKRPRPLKGTSMTDTRTSK